MSEKNKERNGIEKVRQSSDNIDKVAYKLNH